MIKFSGNAQIHLDSFLSVFNISGLPEEYYRNGMVNITLNSRIHFLSYTFLYSNQNYLGYQYEFLAEVLSSTGDTFVDGAVIAAARTLPTWSDGDVPPIPSEERKAAKALQQECKQMLAEFATTSKQDQKLLGNSVFLS